MPDECEQEPVRVIQLCPIERAVRHANQFLYLGLQEVIALDRRANFFVLRAHARGIQTNIFNDFHNTKDRGISNGMTRTQVLT